MKRVICLLLGFAMLFSLCACGSSNVKGTVEPKEEEKIEDTEPKATEEKETEPVVTEEEDELPSLGSISGGQYQNTYFDLACSFNSLWSIATEDEIAALAGYTATLSSDEDLKELLENSGSAYDLYASTSNGLQSVNVLIEKQNLVGNVLIDEETYLELSKPQLPDALKSLGVENIEIADKTLTFAEKTHPALYITASISGSPFYETLVAVKTNSYVALVTAASTFEDRTEDILNAFTTVAHARPAEEPEITPADDVIIGSILDNIYLNRHFGITCCFDSDWSVFDEAALLELNECASADELLASIDTGAAPFDLYATAPDGVSSVNIVLQKMPSDIGELLSEESYLDMALADLESSIESMGAQNLKLETSKLLFAGKEHACVYVQFEYYGYTFYETLIVLRAGDYTAIVTASSIGDNLTLDFLSAFTAA